MNIDLHTVQFSRFGSYMCFGFLPKTWNFPGLIFRTMHVTTGFSRELMRVELLADGAVVEPTITATPAKLTLAHGPGRVEICFAERDVVRIRGRGVGLRLSSVNDQYWRTMPLDARRWQFNPPEYRMQYAVTTLAGRLDVNARRHEAGHRDPRAGRALKPVPLVLEVRPDDAGDGGGGTYELAIEELLTTVTGAGLAGTFDECVARVQAEWTAWLAGTPAVSPRHRRAAELAMYVNWSAVVGASGMNRRPTMLMSKNYMSQCWSWDHCFNAMALAPRQGDLAWDQLMTVFDHQDQFGCLPDSVMSTMTTWAAVKPPIHGWALSHMARSPGVLTPARVKSFYPKLAAWTEWWLQNRDADGDGLPEYMNGCDSGWDNATVFDGGCPVASPDLPAYLVLQLDMLSALAARLGKPRAAADWHRRADALLQRMLERLWDGRQFVSLCLPTGKPFPGGDCLLNFIPIILGKRLPKPHRDRLAAALAPGGRFVTRHGPATESPASLLYNPTGYWRGPIWAPSTLMIVDGLRRGGYAAQAAAIAKRFRDLCARSCFAENFEAQSGEPLCDQAYTWTSSTFLALE